jgi:hypothetical protein
MYAPGLGTLYFDEKEFVTGLTTGQLPTLKGGKLPNLGKGSLPELDPGSLPSLNRGSLPSLSINFSALSFNFNKGKLPTLSKGSLPSLDPGTLPSLNKGSFPKLSGGSLPKPLKSTLPIPNYHSGKRFDRGSAVKTIYQDYKLEWDNKPVSIGLSSFESSPILFGVDKTTYQFFIQIGDVKYGLNGKRL